MKEPRRMGGHGVPAPAPAHHRLARAIALSLPVLALAAAGNAAATQPCDRHSTDRESGLSCARRSAPTLITDTTLETFENGARHALHAEQGQWLQATNVEAISHGDRDDSGQAPAPVMAEGLGSWVVFNGGIARSHGNLGNGADMNPMQRFGTVTARNLGKVDLYDVDVTNATHNGLGVLAQGGSVAMTRGRTTGNIGLQVKGGGHAVLTDVEIRGTSQGISAEGGFVEMRGGSIIMEGTTFRGEAILSAHGGHVEVDGVNVRTTARYDPPYTGQGFTGHGAYVMGLAEVHVRDSEFHVQGKDSAGVQVGYTPDYNIGGLATVTSSRIRVDDGVGMRVWGVDSRGHLKNSEIIAGISGDGSRGLAISNQGNAMVNDSAIYAHGDRAIGADIIGFNTTAQLDGTKVLTYGAESAGVSLSNFAVAQLDNSHIATAGSHSHALALASEASAHVSTTRLHTSGDQAHGVRLVGAGTVLTADDLQISTQGAASHAVDLHGATLSLDGGTLETHGTNAHALHAATAGAPVRLHSAALHAYGNGGRAIYADSALNLDVAGGRLSASAAPAIELLDGHLAMNARDGSAIAGAGGLLRLHGASTATLLADKDVMLQGDIEHTNGGTIAVGLHSQSQWRGASAAVGALSLTGGSRWALTGNSRVHTLSLDNSEIAFPGPAAGVFTTLTVAGDFDAQGATLSMHAALAGDSTAADRLHILGDARGHAQVRVINAGGSGQATSEGIRLIQVDRLSSAVFQLSGRAVAGPYEYFLFQGGITDPTDGDWYLRSVRNGPVAPPDPPIITPPIDPPSPPVSGPIEPEPELPTIDPEALPQPAPLPPPTPNVQAPVLRPETAAYLAVQSTAGMFDHSWHDRVGAPSIGDGKALNGAAGWARLAHHQTTHASFADQLAVSTDTSILQLGAPVAHWGSHGQHQAGLMLASGQAGHQVTSAVSGYGARGSSDGIAWGAYGTWRPQIRGGGAYVDLWWQGAHYRQRVQGIGLPQERWDARSWTGSLEVGSAWPIYSSAASVVQIEPQVQVVHTDYRANTHTEANGTVMRTDQAGGWTWRAGARISGQSVGADGTTVQPFVTVNWRQGSGENAITLDGQRVTGLQSLSRWEVAPGAQIAFQRGWAAWGQLSLHDGADGYGQVSGHIGLRRGW